MKSGSPECCSVSPERADCTGSRVDASSKARVIPAPGVLQRLRRRHWLHPWGCGGAALFFRIATLQFQTWHGALQVLQVDEVALQVLPLLGLLGLRLLGLLLLGFLGLQILGLLILGLLGLLGLLLNRLVLLIPGSWLLGLLGC